MTDVKLVVIDEVRGMVDEDQIDRGIMGMVGGIGRGSMVPKIGRGSGRINERGMMIDVGIP